MLDSDYRRKIEHWTKPCPWNRRHSESLMRHRLAEYNSEIHTRLNFRKGYREECIRCWSEHIRHKNFFRNQFIEESSTFPAIIISIEYLLCGKGVARTSRGLKRHMWTAYLWSRRLARTIFRFHGSWANNAGPPTYSFSNKWQTLSFYRNLWRGTEHISIALNWNTPFIFNVIYNCVPSQPSISTELAPDSIDISSRSIDNDKIDLFMRE